MVGNFRIGQKWLQSNLSTFWQLLGWNFTHRTKVAVFKFVHIFAVVWLESQFILFLGLWHSRWSNTHLARAFILEYQFNAYFLSVKGHGMRKLGFQRNPSDKYGYHKIRCEQYLSLVWCVCVCVCVCVFSSNKISGSDILRCIRGGSQAGL